MAKSLNKPEYDIGAQMEAKGYNPHYCPSMIQYFQKEQMLLKPPSQGGTCHVGDAVFFNWDGSGTAQHAAIVTKVDAQGRPTQIMESNSFNQPAKVTDLVPGSGMYNRIVAVGRLKDATSNDEAANQLPALGANPAKGGPLPAEGPSSGDGYTGDTGFHDYVQDENVRGGNAGPSNVQASPVAPGGTVPKGDFKALMDKLNAMGIDKAYLDELSKKYGVPVEWILGIMMQESGGDPNAGSPAGAKGLMQLMPGTFGSLGVGSNILDPKQNLEAGVKYFSQMYRQFGDLTTAAGHYNSGPGGNLTNPETAQYIKAVPALAQQAKEQLGL